MSKLPKSLTTFSTNSLLSLNLDASDLYFFTFTPNKFADFSIWIADFSLLKYVKAILQPGGSVKDKDVIERANKYKIAMAFSNLRHFKH